LGRLGFARKTTQERHGTAEPLPVFNGRGRSRAMFELLLSVCVSATLCEYRMPALAYDSAVGCQHQAALIAGMVAGGYPSGQPVTFRFLCKEAGQKGGQEPWVEIVLAAE
jgi:hypothetical protein